MRRKDTNPEDNKPPFERHVSFSIPPKPPRLNHNQSLPVLLPDRPIPWMRGGPIVIEKVTLPPKLPMGREITPPAAPISKPPLLSTRNIFASMPELLRHGSTDVVIERVTIPPRNYSSS